MRDVRPVFVGKSVIVEMMFSEERRCRVGRSEGRGRLLGFLMEKLSGQRSDILKGEDGRVRGDVVGFWKLVSKRVGVFVGNCRAMKVGL